MRGTDALLVVAMLALATGLLAYLPSAFGVDSWLELVAGRLIWQSGVPHHETLTLLSHGAAWVDQQWLAQFASYALYRLGGLGLLGLVSVGLMVGGLAGAIAGARRLGASARTVLMLLPLCAWLLVPAREVRTQAFVVPLFVATVYLLASDSRGPSRRVLWTLPILLLWANLHGTASLGAGLIALRGITLAWERRQTRPLWPALRRPLALTLGAPLCLLLTPYGLHTVSYYHATLFNSALKHAVTEWQPITASALIAGPFLVLAGLMIWSFGRRPQQTTPWERLALLALAAVSVTVIRNVAFFALCATMLVPVSLEESASWLSGDIGPARPRVNAIVMAVTATALLIAGGVTLFGRASRLELQYQRLGVLRAVQTAARTDPGLTVFADVRFADWLLWRDPALAGRIAGDARFELLTPDALTRSQRVFLAVGPNWRGGAAGYRLIVLDRRADADAVSGFRAEAGTRALYEDPQRIVLLRATRP